jgi:hypothetical protein
MLTFMSLEDLEFCYLDLNHYYKGEVRDQADLAQTIRNVREWVLNHFQNSFAETLVRYKKTVTQP